MAKRSHKIASRQAAVHKERKKKKKSQGTERRSIISVEQSATTETPDDNGTEIKVTKTAPKPIAISPQESARYNYVYSDLKHIAIIAGPLLLLIIILAFVL